MNGYEANLRKDIKKYSKKIALKRVAIGWINGCEALSVLEIITGAVGLIFSTFPLIYGAIFFLAFFTRRYYSNQAKELKKELDAQLAERDRLKNVLERYEENSNQKQLSPKVKTGLETSTNKENTSVEEKRNSKRSTTVKEMPTVPTVTDRKIGNYRVHSASSAQKPLFQDPYNQSAKNSHLTINQEQVLKDLNRDYNRDYQVGVTLDSQDKLSESNTQESLASIQRAFRKLDKEKGKTLSKTRK